MPFVEVPPGIPKETARVPGVPSANIPTCCSFLVLHKLLCSHTFPLWGLDILNASNPLSRPTSILALCWTLGIPTCGNQRSYLLLWNKDFFWFSASVAFVLISQYLSLRKSWILFCWRFFESPYSSSSPALCAGVCITLPCPSQRRMPMRGYKGFLPAAQLCPFPGWLPAAGAAQRKSTHPSRVPHDHVLGALCSNKTIRALVFALVNVIWKLHADNVPLTQIGLQ